MNKTKVISRIITIFFALILVGWVFWGIACAFGNYNDNVYPFDRADDQFNRAMGTNNLGTFADYAEDGLETISRYSGNEDWWYPTINTDMDSIKLDISLIIENARVVENTINRSSDAYQEALDNAKESLAVQVTRLETVQWLYLGGGRTYIGLIWGWIAILITLIIVLLVILNWHLGTYNNYYN